MYTANDRSKRKIEGYEERDVRKKAEGGREEGRKRSGRYGSATIVGR